MYKIYYYSQMAFGIFLAIWGVAMSVRTMFFLHYDRFADRFIGAFFMLIIGFIGYAMYVYTRKEYQQEKPKR